MYFLAIILAPLPVLLALIGLGYCLFSNLPVEPTVFACTGIIVYFASIIIIMTSYISLKDDWEPWKFKSKMEFFLTLAVPFYLYRQTIKTYILEKIEYLQNDINRPNVFKWMKHKNNYFDEIGVSEKDLEIHRQKRTRRQRMKEIGI